MLPWPSGDFLVTFLFLVTFPGPLVTSWLPSFFCQPEMLSSRKPLGLKPGKVAMLGLDGYMLSCEEITHLAQDCPFLDALDAGKFGL